MATTNPNTDWTQKVVDSIVVGRSQEAINSFRQQPLANKLTALENAVVQPRKSDTADKVTELVTELVKIGAVKPEEAGPIFSDLLIRVHKYNSSNVQANLNTLSNDIRAAQSEAIRNTDVRSLSNQTILNLFLQQLYNTVPLGQQNFEAFKQTLRLFVNEAPNATVFKSGADTMLQVNIRGVNTVNLNAAFKNLYPYWGVVLEGDSIPGSLTSKLSANTRVLLLLLAPFTNNMTFTPDTFISSIMSIYRETVSASLERPEETEREVFETARDLGSEALDLTQTLGYLIKNRPSQVEVIPKSLSPRQMQVLRYIQDSLSDRIDRNGENPSDALDNLHYGFAPSFYEMNGPFIRRLITYMRLAMQNSPSYFREIYTNKYWVPPPSFWTQNYTDFFNEMTNFNPPSAEDQIQSQDLPLIPVAEDTDDDWQWDEYETAMGQSKPLSTVSAPAASSVLESSVGTSSMASAAPNARFLSTIAKATIPPLASLASDYYWPGSSTIAGPLAAAITTAALTPETKRRIKRIREKRAREASRMKVRKIAEANDALSVISDDTVIKPLLGDGVQAARPMRSFKDVNQFAFLSPKTGIQL